MIIWHSHVDHCKTNTLLVPTFCCISCFWSCSFRMRSSFSFSCCCLNCMASCRLKMGRSRLRSIGILSWSFSNSGQLFFKTYTQLDFFPQPLLDWKISWSECYNSLLELFPKPLIWNLCLGQDKTTNLKPKSFPSISLLWNMVKLNLFCPLHGCLHCSGYSPLDLFAQPLVAGIALGQSLLLAVDLLL